MHMSTSLEKKSSTNLANEQMRVVIQLKEPVYAILRKYPFAVYVEYFWFGLATDSRLIDKPRYTGHIIQWL